MKLCKLTLKNLNSFRKQIEIDFEKSPLDDASLVAITGPTGAGKTTLLDAICVALYGKTPRLSGRESQHPRHLISHGTDEGFAEVHFEADGTRYHATWTIKRRGSPQGQLFDDSGELITTKVAQDVESILGLDFNAFKRSVMLAQGEFAAFLKASGEERRKILEATAGIYIYDVLRQALLDKVREVEAANADVLDELNKIPEASHEQLMEAEAELDRLKEGSDALAAQNQRVQDEMQLEVERKESFERLQSSEERQVELLDQQPRIDALQIELKNAERAERLRSEKQTFDTAKSDLEEAEKALGVATTAKNDAKAQVKADQTDFREKEDAYQTASTEHKKKTGIYTTAKLDVGRASDQFVEADNRTSKLANLDDQIDTLSDQLAGKEVQQAQLQEQIDKAQEFLDENPLPSDRQHRLTQSNVLSTKLDSQQQQLETALMSEAGHVEKVSSLECEIEKLSKTHEGHLSKKTEAEATLERADTELNKLQAAGSQDEWNAQKNQAVEAQPIAQKYEAATDDLKDVEGRLHELNKEKTKLDTELGHIEAELVSQEKVYQQAVKTVEQCEETRESALLVNPINQLRLRLQPGEPCSVCGGTHHPHAHIIEPEADDLLRNAEDALEQAKTERQTAQKQMLDSKTRQVEIQQNRRNTVSQIDDVFREVEELRNEEAQLLLQWREIYHNSNVSSEWLSKRIGKADITIAALGEAEQAHTQASHVYQLVSQQLKTCEDDMKRERRLLSDSEKQLQEAKDTVADLQAEIASTEERFWEFLPETFHGVSPNEAVDQFENKIKEIEMREGELSSAKAKLDLLNTTIGADQSSLENLRQDRDDLQDEIDEYRCEGEAFLDAVRENTGGLETVDEIDAAIGELESDLQVKETERDNAQQQLQGSINLSTQKQTAHKISEKQHEGS